MKITNLMARCWIVCFLFATAITAAAAPLSEARLSQVIQDVRLLSSTAAPRPAAVNDNVRLGTAVHTGHQSRAELTFQDLTITRLGENTVFSLQEGTRDVSLEHGSVLLQVPPGAAAAHIRTAAITAAVTGGTAMFGTGPPTKFMVLEGVGTFYPAGHPEEKVTLHGGEMVTVTADGHVQVSTFDVKTVLATSPLITEFPDLANLALILQVQDQQQTDQSNAGSNPPPSKDILDVTSENAVANPTVNQTTTTSAPPSATGPPSTITTPDPYVIGSGTQIQTDPSITTNGVTNYGTFYRGTALDGTPSQFVFGQAQTSFDQMVFNGPQNNLPIAVFKFADLELTGNPTITVPSGGTTNLALVSVGTITSGGPGGILTFAGIQRLDFITQNGSIDLGSEISFSGIDHLSFYARGSGSNLTLASPISGGSVVHLYSQGSTQVNGNISVSDTFTSLTGGDFLAGNGLITATNIDILSLNNININASQFLNPADDTGTVTLNALNTLNLNLNQAEGSGGFGWSSLDASAETINIFGPNRFNFSNSSGGVTFAAGNGGINAAGVEFFGDNLTLTSTGDISIGSAITPTVGPVGGGASIAEGDHILDGSIDAGGAFTSSGDVYTGTFKTVTGATVGGQLQARDINVGNDLTATGLVRVLGGSILVGDNISTQGSLSVDVDENNAFGNITAGDSITANGGIFTPGNPCVVLAGTFISAPAVITGTLQAGTDITIDNTNGVFSFGIIANHIIAGGTLTLVNVPTVGPNNASSTGNDGSTFDDFTMTVGAISSTGPTTPILSSNGGNANPSFSDSNPGNGGNITLNITSGGLTIGDGNNFNSIQAKGGAYNPTGPFGGGNGGTVDITAAGNVLIQNRATDHAGITATTGTVSDVTSQYAGAGGTVDITTSGQVTVDGNVKVSSDDATQNGATGAGRESASGGTIDLQSNLTAGTGITVTSNGGLLSFLNPNAPGPGGSITLSTRGANIVVNGTVEADRGTITIDQNDPAGSTPTISVDGATLTSETLNITGAGDVNVGLTNPVTINAVTIALSAANNLNWSGGILSATATNSDGNVSISAGQAINITNDLDIERTNSGRTSGLNVMLNAGTDLSVGGDLSVSTDISNLTNGANIGIMAGGNLTVGGSLSLQTSANAQSGSGANIDVNVGGTLNAGDVFFGAEFAVQFPQSSGENVTLDVGKDLIVHNTANSGGIDLEIITPVHEVVSSGANLTLSVGGNLVTDSGGDTTLLINNNINQVVNGSNISGTVTGNLSTNNLTVSLSNQEGEIDTGGNIGLAVTGNVTTQRNATFEILNNPGTIGSNATINVTANNISTGGELNATIDNRGGSIGGAATVQVGTTGNLTANSLLVQIDDTNAGSISGNATINMNVAGTATVNGDATVDILGNDPAGSAALNFNGGSYMVAGNFRSTIDGNGTIQFSNTSIQADTVKAGVFGSNGMLMIGGGTLSANTLMKLYATGSNGAIDFTANVTLTCKAAALILAANTITINDNVVVTIAGSFAASVYTNIANYTGFGGNGSTTGTFAGAGASNPQPTASAPPFDDSPAASSATKKPIAIASAKPQNSSTITIASSNGGSGSKAQSSSRSNLVSSSSVSGQSGRSHRALSTDGLRLPATKPGTTTTVANPLNIGNSGQLLSMLDSATPSSNGKITITSSKGDHLSNNPRPSNPGHPDASPGGLNHDRSAAQNQSSKTSVALLDHAHPSLR
jgi:hypothetical protein